MMTLSDIFQMTTSIKNHETSPTNLLIYNYINKSNNRFVFKIKDEYNYYYAGNI